MTNEFNDKLSCLVFLTAQQLNKYDQITVNILGRMATEIVSLCKTEIIRRIDDGYDAGFKIPH